MNNKINDGGPAFPEVRSEDSDGIAQPVSPDGNRGDAYIVSKVGMSVRTWLAGQALPSILSHALNYETHCDAPKNPWTQEAVIALAVSYADKMIAALEKS